MERVGVLMAGLRGGAAAGPGFSKVFPARHQNQARASNARTAATEYNAALRFFTAQKTRTGLLSSEFSGMENSLPIVSAGDNPCYRIRPSSSADSRNKKS
jgi:hypothetical protein